MKYVVPVAGAQHLFDVTEFGLLRAKELAIASNSYVLLEDNAGKEIVFPNNKTIKFRKKNQ